MLSIWTSLLRAELQNCELADLAALHDFHEISRVSMSWPA